MAVYSYAAVCRHIRQEHSGCPDFAVEYIAKEIAARTWTKTTTGMAVGITMQNLLRHLMTEYDTLLLHGMERKTARKRVQPKIQAMLDG